MSETPFEAQRRKLRELRGKQDGSVGREIDTHISKKAAARRAVEAEERKASKKKASKKKAGKVTTE